MICTLNPGTVSKLNLYIMDIYEIGIIQWFKDLSNFRKFRKQMKSEFKRRDSLFNKYKLKLNWLGNVVYVQLDCTDNDLMNFNYVAEDMVMTKLKPIITYLSDDLGWGDYLTPQISNFVDEDENLTLSYGVLFIFTGYKLTMTNLMVSIVTGLACLAGLIFGTVKYLIP